MSEDLGMSKLVQSNATYDDLHKVPEKYRAELIEGDLYATSRPSIRCIRAATHLGGELYNPFHRGRGGPGGWSILDGPEVHLGPHVLVPDVAGWRKETLKDSLGVKFYITRPDWVCEVLSPSTASLDRVKKWRVYESQQVPWLWLIDPIGRTLEAFERQGAAYVHLGTWGPGECPRIRPFEAIELELDALWGTEPIEP